MLASALGKKLLLKRSVPVSSYGAEATALFARMSVQPDATHKGYINTLIEGLKTDGVWTLLDVFDVFAADNATDALLNWKSTSFNPTLGNGAMTWTQYEGYTGANTKYLDTNFNPTSAAGNFSLNSATAGLYVRNNPGTGIISMGASALPAIRMQTRSAADACTTVGPNSSTSTTSSATICSTHAGMTSCRRNTNAVSITRNGVSVGTSTHAPTGLQNVNINILGNGTSSSSTEQVSMFYAGAFLDDTKLLALYNRFQTYMTSLGKQV
jgi:hypothetical protein